MLKPLVAASVSPSHMHYNRKCYKIYFHSLHIWGTWEKLSLVKLVDILNVVTTMTHLWPLTVAVTTFKNISKLSIIFIK